MFDVVSWDGSWVSWVLDKQKKLYIKITWLGLDNKRLGFKEKYAVVWVKISFVMLNITSRNARYFSSKHHGT